MILFHGCSRVEFALLGSWFGRRFGLGWYVLVDDLEDRFEDGKDVFIPDQHPHNLLIAGLRHPFRFLLRICIPYLIRFIDHDRIRRIPWCMHAGEMGRFDVPNETCETEESLLVSEEVGRRRCIRVREMDWGWRWPCGHWGSGIFSTCFLLVVCALALAGRRPGLLLRSCTLIVTRLRRRPMSTLLNVTQGQGCRIVGKFRKEMGTRKCNGPHIFQCTILSLLCRCARQCEGW